ncbi:MAG: hypothetical protein CMO46_12155, partial [Verrucomicrobiales bacterium]|nr:hypothetical protein [Verrucomicrobiales bacterium]
MNIKSIIYREIRFNLWSFIAGIIAVFISLSSYLIAISISANLQIETEKTLQSMRTNLNNEVSSLEDGIRKSMKGLG